MCGKNRFQHYRQPPTGSSLATANHFHQSNHPQTLIPIPTYKTETEHLERIMAHCSLALCGLILILIFLVLEQVQLLEINYDEELLQSNHPGGHQHHIPFRDNQHEDLYDHETSDTLHGDANTDFGYFDMDEYVIQDHDNDYYLNTDYDQINNNSNDTGNYRPRTNNNVEPTLQNASMSNVNQTNLSTNVSRNNQQPQSNMQKRRKPPRTYSPNEEKLKKSFTQLNPQASSESSSSSSAPFLTSSLRESTNNEPISDSLVTIQEVNSELGTYRWRVLADLSSYEKNP